MKKSMTTFILSALLSLLSGWNKAGERISIYHCLVSISCFILISGNIRKLYPVGSAKRQDPIPFWDNRPLRPSQWRWRFPTEWSRHLSQASRYQTDPMIWHGFQHTPQNPCGFPGECSTGNQPTGRRSNSHRHPSPPTDSWSPPEIAPEQLFSTIGKRWWFVVFSLWLSNG